MGSTRLSLRNWPGGGAVWIFRPFFGRAQKKQKKKKQKKKKKTKMKRTWQVADLKMALSNSVIAVQLPRVLTPFGWFLT